MKRRQFLADLIYGATIAVTLPLSVTEARANSTGIRYLRPPGSLPEDQFKKQCIRCGQCGEVCPNRCITYFGIGHGTEVMDTPFIVPREQACILCMKCGDVCPSGAIQPIKKSYEDILGKVRMGKARVDETLCLSFQGKTCGVCYRACKLADVAIRIGMLEQPHVLEGCVGCGLCERSCIQIPQAIRVIPDYG